MENGKSDKTLLIFRDPLGLVLRCGNLTSACDVVYSIQHCVIGFMRLFKPYLKECWRVSQGNPDSTSKIRSNDITEVLSPEKDKVLLDWI